MRVPVIALTGHLGAGKTTVLNHLLRRPGARVGVVVNDFGEINIDAGLVVGQVDEPASIAGGCICCAGDDDGLDTALRRPSQPRLALDAIIVEASGIADPAILARMIRFSGAEHVRPGGVIDVIDAVHHFGTVDLGGTVPLRYAAASLVVINKVDQLEPVARAPMVRRIEARVRERNPRPCVVPVTQGRVDPALVFDVTSEQDDPDQLPLRSLSLLLNDHSDDQSDSVGAGGGVAHTAHQRPHQELNGADHSHDAAGHRHVTAVTVSSAGSVDPGRVIDLLEDPPPGVYRIKGAVTVRARTYRVDLVGRSVHVRTGPPPCDATNRLVAIGPDLDAATARRRLAHALEPAGAIAAAGLRRLHRHRRLSR